jgi:HSP20 family protein
MAMSESNVSRRNKMLVFLVALLVAVVAVQGYYLFQVHHRLNADTIPVTNGNSADTNRVSNGDGQGAAPPSGVWGPQDPFGSFFSTPLDPDQWNPFDDIEQMRKQMDQLFDQTFKRFNSSPLFNQFSPGVSYNPKLDIEENDREYIVRMDIPGADSSKINASIEDRTLTISGEREEEISGQRAGKQLRGERRLGRFERVLTLPGPVKQDGMKANYKDGVLTVTIPKDTALPPSSRIPIQ